MVKSITKKQTIYLLLICLIGTKFQRLPSFLVDISGKDFWMVLFIYLLIDGLFLSITCKIINLGNGATLYELLEKTIGKIFTKILFVVLSIYFLMLAILPYESVHEVFADIIFDSLPWRYFAIFVLITIACIAISGLRNIGRICQCFFYVIAIGIVGLFILGATTSDLSAILPITDVMLSSVWEGIYKSTIWFGNFTILFVLMGKIKNQEDGKFGGLKLSFYLGSLFVAAAFIVFYGIYQNTTPLKRNWLTKVSQFALLSLDVGRIDWFLILFAELATIITAGIFIFCSAFCFREVIGVKKINVIVYSLLLILYLNTTVIVKGKLDIFRFFITYGAGFGIFVQYVLPLFFLIIAFVYNKKFVSKNELDKFKYGGKNKKSEVKV